MNGNEFFIRFFFLFIDFLIEPMFEITRLCTYMERLVETFIKFSTQFDALFGGFSNNLIILSIFLDCMHNIMEAF